MNGRLTSLVVSMLLWGIFFIKIPVLILGGLLLAIVCFLIAIRQGAGVDRIVLVLAANLAYWIASGLVTGGIHLSMFFDPGYLLGEGRGFLYYIPLLALSVAIVGKAQIFNTLRTLFAIGVGTMLLFIVWAVFRPGLLSGGPVGNFYGFVTSHTGAGTFFAIVGAFLALYGHQTQRRFVMYLGIILALPVFGSASREAIAGLLAVLGWYVVRLGRARLIGYSTLLVLLFVATMPVLTPHTWERTSSLFTEDTVTAVVTTLKNSNWEPGLTPDVEGKQYNVLARFLYWEYAARLFASSPYVGVGFGRFNDTEAEYVGYPGTVWIAASGPPSPAQLQAHNSYLHFLAEIGIVGLGLMLWLWVAMYRQLRIAERYLVAAPDIAAYYVACQGLIIFVLTCSLVGHALASPIIGIPVLSLISIGLAYSRGLVCYSGSANSHQLQYGRS